MPKFFSTQKQYIFIGVAFLAILIGFGDSVYLTISHYSSVPVVCNIIDGCSTVLASSWATIFGIPVSVLGVLYYATLLTLLTVFFFRRDRISHSGLLAVATIGMMMSFWFLYLQIWEIEAFCQFCLLSFISTLCVWIAALFIKPRLENNKDA
ncbi:MAG: vitamin K epoxide reductase family protein [Candidatus Paceibacterota bacterium]